MAFITLLSTEELAFEVVKDFRKDQTDNATEILNEIFKVLVTGGKHLSVIKLLLEDERVDVAAGCNWAIRHSSYSGQTEIVKLLLTNDKVDPSDCYNCAIEQACLNGHIEIVTMLLESGKVDPSDNNNYCIRVSGNYHKIMELLLKDERVDPSVDDCYVVKAACSNNRIDILKLLISHEGINKFNLSFDNNYLINYAIDNEHNDLVKLLIPVINIDNMPNYKVLKLLKDILIKENVVNENKSEPIKDDIKTPDNPAESALFQEQSNIVVEESSLEVLLKQLVVKMQSRHLSEINILQDGTCKILM